MSPRHPSNRPRIAVAGRAAFLAALISALSVSGLVAQDRWQWPDAPKNLQVLPKEWNGQRLRPLMLGFTNALGVSCSHCHVGEEGKPLSTFDFASDANPNKDRAREMYRMLGSVNEHLGKITPSGPMPVNMWCHTCHAGRPRPATLGEELGWAYEGGGIDSALTRYARLKEEFHGRGAYDFGEDALNRFGYDLLGKEDIAGAIRIFAMNAEAFPRSSNVWDSLGEARLKAGDKTKAAEAYRKALELDPSNRSAAKALEELGGKR